ncbi:MAG: signal peptidase II [Deltaproteobacteria bacterium]|nr:signal peptidase II [Deltaproteobacteria bacterium]
MKNKYLLFVLITAAILVLDQWTKTLVLSHMAIGESIDVIDGFFSISYIRNPGAAFGFLATASPLFRSIFFLAATVAAILLILYYFKNTAIENQWMIISLSLILSGALGNLIDRLRFGEVIDFLDVYIRSCHWPAFNVADSAITVGAVILIWQMIIKGKEKKD